MSDDVIPFPGKRPTDEYGRRLLKTEEVAERLGFCKDTIYRWPPERLPYTVVSPRGDRRYRAEDVEAYIEENMVRTSREAS